MKEEDIEQVRRLIELGVKSKGTVTYKKKDGKAKSHTLEIYQDGVDSATLEFLAKVFNAYEYELYSGKGDKVLVELYVREVAE